MIAKLSIKMLCKCKFSANYSEKILMTFLITEDFHFYIIIICAKLIFQLHLKQFLIHSSDGANATEIY